MMGLLTQELAASRIHLVQATADDRDLHKRDGAQATNLVEGTEKAEHRTLRVVEKDLPRIEVLDTVEEHAVDPRKGNVSMLKPYNPLPRELGDSPIVTGSGRGNTQHKGVEVKLPETGILGPLDPLELGGLLLGGHRRVSVRLLV
jgi:hypothetical protein